MSEVRKDLDALIESVVDGHDVDWESARAEAASSERRLLEQLRLVATIGAFATAPAPPRASALSGGDRWGTFELLQRLGQGASGEVWRARDVHLDRQVALKLLPDASSARPLQPADTVLREGHLLARVRHPNVVTVYGAARHDGRIGLWMECIDGRTLAEEVNASGPLDATEAATIGADICRALTALHAAGLIHRDVKPQNVMREADGRTVLMDLGVGIDARESGNREPSAGTPLYVAPEVFAANTASAASDLYSLGVVLFYLVSGTYPVRGETLGDVAEAHRTQRRVWLREVSPDLPDTFISVVERALEHDPMRRFTSAREMEQALVEFVDSMRGSRRGGTSKRRTRLWAVAAAITAFGALAGALSWSAFDRAGDRSPQAIAFSQRETILVAAFENHTGDPSLDRALDRALAHELRQSPHVVVAPIQRVDNALRLMDRPVGTLLNRSTAREVALRDGGMRLVLAGLAEKVGNTYVLTVEVIEPEQGAVRQSLREEAESQETIVHAIGRLASRLRTALGEPAESVAVTHRQLEKVTSPSLAAVRLYSEAYEAGSRQLWAQSESLVRSALELEPEFPSALNWLGWSLLRQDKPRQHWMPYFERAFQGAERTTDRERYFIAGSYLHMAGEFTGAISAYQALVRLHPDHAWGVNNLTALLHQAGRRLEISDLLDELVRARPDDMELTFRAAVETLTVKGLEAARPHVIRAQSFVGRRPVIAFHSLWLELFETHEHWLAGHAHDASASLLAALSSESGAAASPDMRSNVAGYFHLALGQAHDATARFESISSVPMRAYNLALVALVRGDAPEVARRLTGYEGRDGFAALVLMRAGYPREAQAVLRRIQASMPPSTDPAWDAIRAEIDPSLPVDQRMAALRRVVFEVPVGWDTARYYLHAETLASLLAASGDREAALRVLETASSYREHAHRDPVHLGYFWLHLQKQLADAYRREGRLTDAERIEAILLRTLGAADEDFPLLVELQARRSPAEIR